MPSNRSNSERGKAFDIDTKIEYMNKLYEVRESNSCCDCSLATICSSSNISASDRNDDALSRDKRINIFGECSHVRRPDTKSVVFVEIPKNNTQRIIVRADEHPGLICSSSIPDGKSQRRESRRRAIRRRKGRL